MDSLPTKVSELENDKNFVTSENIPTQVSQLSNDKGYITIDEVPSVPTMVSELDNDSKFITMDSIPTKVSELENDKGFITSENIPTQVSQLSNDKGYITIDEVPVVPTKVSELENDSKFITMDSIPTKVSELENDKNFVTSESIPTQVSQLSNDKGYITIDEVPVVPTKVSELENDSKFITMDSLPTKVSELENDKNFVTSENIPTQVSQLSNDKGYITIDEVPAVPTKVSELENDSKFITMDSIPTKVSQFENDALYITQAQLDAIVSRIDALETKNAKLQYSLDSLTDIVMPYKRATSNTYSFSLTSFNQASDVYKNLKTGDRIMFIIRHSKRNDDYSFGSKLTEEGIQMTLDAGAQLSGGLAGVNDSYYGSTAYPRCKQTSYYIASSRGDTEPSDTTDVHAPISVLNGDYFTTNTKWPFVAQYYDNYKEAANDSAVAMVTTLCKLSQGHTFAWFTSHDFTTLILTEWATDGGINFSSPQWINYLTGVAVIVHADKTWEVYPVTCLDSGFNTDKGDYSTWW